MENISEKIHISNKNTDKSQESIIFHNHQEIKLETDQIIKNTNQI